MHQKTGFPLTTAVRDEHERALATLCLQLSAADFAAAWETGESMTLEGAVAYAWSAYNSPSPIPNA